MADRTPRERQHLESIRGRVESLRQHPAAMKAIEGKASIGMRFVVPRVVGALR
jgi:hypothetical protein